VGHEGDLTAVGENISGNFSPSLMVNKLIHSMDLPNMDASNPQNDINESLVTFHPPSDSRISLVKKPTAIT